MEEQKDYIAEAKRIAEEIKATEEHILELGVSGFSRLAEAV